MAKTLKAYRIKEETADKLQYIAWFERTKATDIVQAQFDAYIKRWEGKNGQISAEMIAKAKDKI